MCCLLTLFVHSTLVAKCDIKVQCLVYNVILMVVWIQMKIDTLLPGPALLREDTAVQL